MNEELKAATLALRDVFNERIAGVDKVLNERIATIRSADRDQAAEMYQRTVEEFGQLVKELTRAMAEVLKALAEHKQLPPATHKFDLSLPERGKRSFSIHHADGSTSTVTEE